MPPDHLVDHVNAILINYSGLVTTSEEAYRSRASLTNLFQNDTNVVYLHRLLDIIEEAINSNFPQVNLVVRDVTTAHRYITTRKPEIDRATKQFKILIAAISKSANPVELKQVFETFQSIKVAADRAFQTEKKLQQALVRRLNERISFLKQFTQEVREFPSKIGETNAENEKILIQLKHANDSKDSLEAHLAELVEKKSALQFELKRHTTEQEVASSRIEALAVRKDAADGEIVTLEALLKTIDTEIDTINGEIDAAHAKNEEVLLADRSGFQAELSEVTSRIEERKAKFSEVKQRHEDTNARLKDIADEEISVDLKLQKEILDIAETLTKITNQQDEYQLVKEARERHKREQAEILEAERRARQEQARVAAEKAEAERLQREEEARLQAEKDRRLAEFEAKEAAELERKQKMREKRLQRKRERTGHVQQSKHDASSEYHSDTSSVFNHNEQTSTPVSSNQPKESREKAAKTPQRAKSAAPEEMDVDRYSDSDSDDNYVPTPEKRGSSKRGASLKPKQKKRDFVPETPEMNQRKKKVQITPSQVEDSGHRKAASTPSGRQRKIEHVESSLLFVSGSHSAEDEEHSSFKDKKTPIAEDAKTTDKKTPVKGESSESPQVNLDETLEVFKHLTKVETSETRRKPKATVSEKESSRKPKPVVKESAADGLNKPKLKVVPESSPEVYSSRRPQRASTRTAQRNIHDQLKQLQVQFSDDEEDKVDKNAYIPKKNVTPNKSAVVAPVPPPRPTIVSKFPKVAPPPPTTTYTEAEMSFWDC